MTEAATRLKGELAQLTPDDRAELAHFLIDTLEESADDDVAEAWNRELARRAAEIRAGTASGQPAEQVLAQLRAKHS